MNNQEPLIGDAVLRFIAIFLAVLFFVFYFAFEKNPLISIFLITGVLVSFSIFIYTFNRIKYWWTLRVITGSVAFFFIIWEVDLFVSVINKTININEFLVSSFTFIIINRRIQQRRIPNNISLASPK